MEKLTDGDVMTARLTSIVAIDRNGAIGCRNELPWKLKSDMDFFRKSTMNHTVIMGRKTYDSIGGLLKKRINIVLSHNSLLFPSTPDCQLALSLEEALARANVVRAREIFVVGGAATYSEFAHLVDRYLVTIVDHEAKDADAYLSDEILKEIEVWETNEIAAYPPTQGRDEFGFKVFEVDAPDVEDRVELRQRMVARHMIKSHKASALKPRPNTFGSTSIQEAFAF